MKTTYIWGRSGHPTGRVVALLSAVLVLWQAPFAIGQQNAVSEYNVPKEVRRCMKSLGTAYEISGKINPFYLRGDFDGDGKTDYAVLVQKENQQGLVVCWGSSAKPVVLGAGIPLRVSPNLDFDAWLVYAKTPPVARGVGEVPPPKLVGDAIELIWEERASALVYWNGKRFVWYQQGD